MAEHSLRTLTLAYKVLNGKEDFEEVDESNVYEIEKKGFTLLAIIGIKDALRANVKTAVK